MEEQDADDAAINVAESLQDRYATLSVGAANKVRTMQGLDPIEMPDDSDGAGVRLRK